MASALVNECEGATRHVACNIPPHDNCQIAMASYPKSRTKGYDKEPSLPPCFWRWEMQL